MAEIQDLTGEPGMTAGEPGMTNEEPGMTTGEPGMINEKPVLAASVGLGPSPSQGDSVDSTKYLSKHI
jgi:hypothetical protein